MRAISQEILQPSITNLAWKLFIGNLSQIPQGPIIWPSAPVTYWYMRCGGGISAVEVRHNEGQEIGTHNGRVRVLVCHPVIFTAQEEITLNTLRPRQNGRRFADDTFKRILLNVRISIKISLKFVPNGPINNNPALVQIMAWCRSGDKQLSEPMMVGLLTHISVTRPQWVNNYYQNKMADILQTAFATAFSWQKVSFVDINFTIVYSTRSNW